MIVDTSAILAILFKEPGYEVVVQKLARASKAGIGAPTLVECAIVLTARLGKDARGLLARFVEEAAIAAIPFTETHYGMAVGAWLKYGKGRHAAGLNLGDCLTYAVARVADMPLLCVGNDFLQTDLALA
jgi:ribonuclease VapC